MAGEQAKEDDEVFEIVEDEGGRPATGGAEAAEARGREADEDDDEDERDEDGDGDSRVHADADEDAERRREQRRAERQAKKERRKQFRDADRRTIEELKRQNEALMAQMGQITGHLAQNESQRIDGEMARAQADHQRAEAIYAEAIRTGDGTKAAQALRAREDAAARYHRSADLKNRMAQTRAAAPAAPAVDPRVKNHAETFMRKHSWYNPNGSDQDSGIVNAIDNAVTAEGFEQGSQEYWDELEDRMRQQLPHRFKKRGRPAPPVGGASDAVRQTGKPTRVVITRERREAMIEAGAWDDPVKRQRLLKRYAEMDRAQNR